MKTDLATIQVQDLEKRFGDFTAVSQVSFTVYRGEIFGFLGPNGSGKTTTIRIMLGLLPPTQGSIRVLDHEVPARIQRIRPRIGYMSQQFSLYNDLTVSQNLEFYGQAYGIPSGKLAQAIQEAVGLAGLRGHERTPTKDLSGGWRQRLALSAAILHQPEILFLDEPTAGVDPVSRRAFWDLLYDLVADGITVFITTHYLDEAEHCHRLAFIQRGKIIAQGIPSKIKQHILPGKILEIDAAQPEQLIHILQDRAGEKQGEVLVGELYGSLVHVASKSPREDTRKIRTIARKSGIDIRSIHSIDPTLEDVFIASMRDTISGGSHEY